MDFVVKLESSWPFVSHIPLLGDLASKFITYLLIMSSHRKSVAFSDEHTIVASNGEVTEVNGTALPEKTSAERHSVGECIYTLYSYFCTESEETLPIRHQ